LNSTSAPLETAHQQQYLPPYSIDLSSLSLSAAASAIVFICGNTRRCALAAAIQHQLRPNSKNFFNQSAIRKNIYPGNHRP
jgi:hypothetical protein